MLDRAAIFISVLALCLSVYEGMETRKHNRLSVTPHLVFYDSLAQKKDRVGLFLENGGLGPAIIREMHISLDGKEVKGWDEVTAILTSNPGEDPFVERNPRRVSLTSGYVVPSGREEALYTTKPEFVKDWKAFETIFSKRLQVTISYCSFYDICESVTFNK